MLTNSIALLIQRIEKLDISHSWLMTLYSINSRIFNSTTSLLMLVASLSINVAAAQSDTTLNAPEMVSLPGATFSKTRDSETTEVIVSPFAISKYEITFDQYDAFAIATDRELPDDYGWGRGNLPVIYVSWNDALAYTQWLSEQTGEVYRLPTEDEWEYAARGGTTTDFPWGDSVGRGEANCLDCDFRQRSTKTLPVGSFQPNAFGLYDMNGNVWEWCDDWESDFQHYRVIRGGAWDDSEDWITSSSRHRWPPTDRHFNVGFRVARNISE